MKKIILPLAVLPVLCFAADPVPPADIAANLAENKDLDGAKEWTNTFSLGGSLTRGNSETTAANGRFASEKFYGKSLFLGTVEGAYGTTENEAGEDETNVSNAKAVADYKYRLDGYYLCSLASLENNDMSKISYRGILGAGVGTFLVDTAEVRASVQAMAGELWEKVAGEEDDYAVFMFAERVDWIISETAKAWESVNYIVQADDFDNSLLNAEVGVESALRKSVKIGLVLKYDYDETPAEGCEKDDLSLIAQISFAL